MIPPHMMKAIAEHAERHGDPEGAARARATLAVTHAHREQRRRTAGPDAAMCCGCGLVDELRAFEAWAVDQFGALFALLTADGDAGQHGDDGQGDGGGAGQPAPTDPSGGGTGGGHAGPDRSIYDGAGDEDSSDDRLVRGEGAPISADVDVNQAYDGLGAVWGYYQRVHGRNSLDGDGLPLDAVVHYGRAYDNAFWDGSAMQFGDGDGVLFGDFTACLDVIGHELTHGVTQYAAGLEYRDQAGALNEHISDVFGSLVKQYANAESAQEADWLIGAGLLAPGVQGRALRDMLHPGTAYNDPRLGTDPQPADMAHYVQTSEDDGGVHINSGIPNRAFALAATALPGAAWETVGPVWYAVLTGGSLPADCTFAEFAAATRAAAAGLSRADVGQAVDEAWATVGL